MTNANLDYFKKYFRNIEKFADWLMYGEQNTLMLQTNESDLPEHIGLYVSVDYPEGIYVIYHHDDNSFSDSLLDTGLAEDYFFSKNLELLGVLNSREKSFVLFDSDGVLPLDKEECFSHFASCLKVKNIDVKGNSTNSFKSYVNQK